MQTVLTPNKFICLNVNAAKVFAFCVSAYTQVDTFSLTGSGRYTQLGGHW